MIEQGIPFSWYFTDDHRRELSTFRSPVSGHYALRRRIQLAKMHWQISTLSSHETLDEAIAASEALIKAAK